jgi:hypothetical protein
MSDQRTRTEPLAPRAKTLREKLEGPAAIREIIATLEAFADPQHWAIRREAAEPAFVWIGTYRVDPISFARVALDRLDEIRTGA